MRTLANMIHCRVGKLSVMYLGLALGARARSMVMWNLVIEKFKKLSSTWKKRCLSLRGWINLIKDGGLGS